MFMDLWCPGRPRTGIVRWFPNIRNSLDLGQGHSRTVWGRIRWSNNAWTLILVKLSDSIVNAINVQITNNPLMNKYSRTTFWKSIILRLHLKLHPVPNRRGNPIYKFTYDENHKHNDEINQKSTIINAYCQGQTFPVISTPKYTDIIGVSKMVQRILRTLRIGIRFCFPKR